MSCSEWLCVLILTKIIHCFFSMHYYKTFWNSSCFSGNGNGREWELLVRNKWELDYSLRFPKAGNGNEVMRIGNTKVIPHISTLYLNHIHDTFWLSSKETPVCISADDLLLTENVDFWQRLLTRIPHVSWFIMLKLRQIWWYSLLAAIKCHNSH